jgi:hypothetical protein
MKHLSKLCGKISEHFHVRAGGTCTNHCAIKRCVAGEGQTGAICDGPRYVTFPVPELRAEV